MKNKIIKNIKGFTLVELLIVIAIIGVLSALLMANFVGVRQRARDAQRKSDLRQVQSALELYRSDLGLYPTTQNGPDCDAALSSGTTTYMTKVPCDPTNTSFYSGSYYYYSDGSVYYLVACLENSSDSQAKATTDSEYQAVPSINNTGCSSNRFYIVSSP